MVLGRVKNFSVGICYSAPSTALSFIIYNYIGFVQLNYIRNEEDPIRNVDTKVATSIFKMLNGSLLHNR